MRGKVGSVAVIRQETIKKHLLDKPNLIKHGRIEAWRVAD